MLSVGLIHLRSLIRQLIRDERAATMVEYALMLALIAVVCIVAVRLIGNNASTQFNNAATNLQQAAPAGQ